MENQTTQPKKVILNYGLILGVISVFLSVIAYVTNTYLDPHWSVMVIGMLVFIAVLVYGIKAFKKQNGGFLSISQALKVGIGIALIGGIIGAIWMLLLTNVLEPDYMEQVADVQREQMLENYPDMSEAQMNQALEMSAKFSSPWIAVATSIVVNLFIGFLVALIIGAIMKQKRPFED